MPFPPKVPVSPPVVRVVRERGGGLNRHPLHGSHGASGGARGPWEGEGPSPRTQLPSQAFTARIRTVPLKVKAKLIIRSRRYLYPATGAGGEWKITSRNQKDGKDDRRGHLLHAVHWPHSLDPGAGTRCRCCLVFVPRLQLVAVLPQLSLHIPRWGPPGEYRTSGPNCRMTSNSFARIAQPRMPMAMRVSFPSLTCVTLK